MNQSLLNADAAEETQAEETQTEETQTEETQEQEVPSGDRPEWLPEKFKAPEDLAQAYKELSSKLGQRDDDLRKQIEEERMAGRPETSGDYVLPDSVDSSAVDNDLLKWWAEHSYERGYDQAQFEKGIEAYAQAVQVGQPDIEAEAKRLGDDAASRAEAASLFAAKFFPKEVIPAIERMCETADGIFALEFIMEKTKDRSFADTAESPGGLSEQKLWEMMQDPRYGKDHKYSNEVTKAYQRYYDGM